MMTLRFSPNSPYARKARVVIIEAGLSDAVEAVPADPWAPGTDLVAQNPLSKVPALVTEEGLTLFDSPVICEYLDSRHDGPKLFPAAGEARWRALRLQALGDGICDAAILRRLESQRSAEQQSAAWIDRQRAAVARALDLLEGEAATLEGPPTIGSLTVACALGYLDLRFAGEDWRAGRPALAAWYATVSQRPSLRDTVPPGP